MITVSTSGGCSTMSVTCYGQDAVAIGGMVTNNPDPFEVGYIYAIAKIL